MKHVLVTGAFGNVGRSTVRALKSLGCTVRAFEAPNRAFARNAAGLGVEAVAGDVRDPAAVGRALEGMDAVIHLAAIIPPAAEDRPDLARSVNVDGTRAVLSAVADSKRRPFLVFSSSVAVYGDRVEGTEIQVGDPLAPNDDDEYGKQKVECEALVRGSGLDWP